MRDALEREFRDLIDMADRAKQPEHDRNQAFYSRGLAALAACHLSGCDPKRAASGVIDGYDDGGFDAVVSNDAGNRLWLVQAKWSDRGSASINTGDAGKMSHGLFNIPNSNFEKFNARFQRLVPEVDATISDPNVRITLVVALAGPPSLSKEVDDVFNRIRKDANSPQEIVDIAVVGLGDFHKIVKRGISAAPINLDIRLESPGFDLSPYTAYQGTLPAAAIASWYDDFGQQLFDQNIRRALGITTVNQGIADTLSQRPDLFLYFNNGITVLCDTIKRNAKYAVNVGGPIDLTLNGVSVVNGAQTVASLHQAVASDPTIGAKAKVWVRLISLEGAEEGLAKLITVRTNTQNQIELRDFVALDETQLRLRDEFALSLGRTYVIKRGDSEPLQANGCSVVEAAQALACAQPEPGLVARSKKNIDVLFELADRGPYHAIFNRQTNAYRVWRSVQVLRTVKTSVAQTRSELGGRASQIALHGDTVIAHLVFRRLDPKGLDDPDLKWEDVELIRIPKLALESLNWLIHRFEATVPPSAFVQSLFKNTEKTKLLVADVLHHMDDGGPVPESSARPQKSDDIELIIDGRLLTDGTPLEFRTITQKERRLLGQWLRADERRAQAIWLNDRSSPLVWAADGKQYTPSGLLRHMLAMVTNEPQRIVQGSAHWFVPGRGSLDVVAVEGNGVEGM